MTRFRNFCLTMFVAGVISSIVSWADPVSLLQREYQRVTAAVELGLPITADDNEIFMARFHQWRAQEVGLPATATDDEIRAVKEKKSEEARSAEAVKIGLPETATWEEISQEENRQDDLSYLGLPNTATKDDIETASDLRARADKADDLGLPATSSWADIEKAAEAEKVKRRAQLAVLLNLPATATADELTAELLKRRPAD